MFSSVVLLALIACVVHCNLEHPAKKYTEDFEGQEGPCFEKDKEKENEFKVCQQEDCQRNDIHMHKDKLQLVRLDGVKTGHMQELDLGEEKNFTLITRAMKPLMFEIPHFLTNEECDHIIHLAKQNDLETSIAGFNKHVYEGDLGKELTQAGNEILPLPQYKYVRYLTFWDRNMDGIIDTREIKFFTSRVALLYFQEDEIHEMFVQIGFNRYKNGMITPAAFTTIDMAKLVVYLEFVKKRHPRYRDRYSEQTWLGVGLKKTDPVFRRLHERVIKLTKLPRKIIQGSESLQVVHYGPHGHYHVHFDSMPVNDSKTRDQPCCHHKVERANGCRLCRFITILYYLNDVKEGGETAFIVADNATMNMEVLLEPNKLDVEDDLNLSANCVRGNLIVKPKKGQAIMWYNHFVDKETGLLGDVDNYSIHGGCDVTKGEKWIANNWITAPSPGTEHLKSLYDI